MPKIFKTLANIGAWTLWICAWLAFLPPFFIDGIGKGYLWKVSEAPMGYWISYGLAIGATVSAAFWILVRRKLEV